MKSRACRKVLRLMDAMEDPSYRQALETVLSQDRRLSRVKLETELNLYI